MAVDSRARERTQKANSEAKVLLGVILGFAAIVVLFMVFMMANAPREGVIFCDEPEQIQSESQTQSQSQSQSESQPQSQSQSNWSVRPVNMIVPLHPSLPGGSSAEDCIQPRYFQNS